ncbi:MAG: SMC-Scp complex subunit ScpB [Candidatus Eisenbacteria sp.]|nr:SMC-Scp complex subunit ScpB [Candidatus Eisenbacteria bacterium]
MDREDKSVLVDEVVDTLPGIVEALLFASDSPLSVQKLASLVDDADPADVRDALARLAEVYDRQVRAFQLVQVAGGYQLCTLPRYAHWVERLYKGRQKSRLSNAALETLAIIGYKQPIAKAEIAEIRGVDVDGVLRTLMERNLVTVVGRKETPGRPLLFGTSKEFLLHFGLNLIQDLPSIEEMEELIREKSLSSAREEFLPEPSEELETRLSETGPSD